MAENIITSNLENLSITNVQTNKICHLCLGEFSSVPELHKHIDNDHDFGHPTMSWNSSDSKSDSSPNSKQQQTKK